jgi:hypothetical protein
VDVPAGQVDVERGQPPPAWTSRLEKSCGRNWAGWDALAKLIVLVAAKRRAVMVTIVTV